MSTTKAKWVDGILQFFNGTTHETVGPRADVVFYDDFLGADGLAAIPAGSSEEAGCRWCVVDVGDATEAFTADAPNGAVLLHIHATSEAEDAVLYWGDQLGLSVANGGILEFRATLTTLPTTGVACVAGLAGPHDLDKDTVANHAWFRWQASGALVCESDDTTTNLDDKATGITSVAGTYDIYKIDFTDLEDVRFYVNGVHVCTTITFDMSDLTAAEKVMQPYFSLDKASGTGVGDLTIDYVKFWGPRG